MNNQRRIFLKVLATGPLVGCAGADPVSAPGGGGSEPATGGAPAGGTGSGSTSGGKPFVAGGSASTGSTTGTGSGGTSPFVVGGTGTSGSTGGSTLVGDGGAATGTAGTGAATGGTAPANPNLVAAGNVSDVAMGSLVVAAGLFLVGHDAQGIYAMSMQCPHKGCAVVFSGQELDCPCHHSRFDRNGNVLVGPATSPLPHLAVTIDGAGNILVDRYTVVGLSTRTPV